MAAVAAAAAVWGLQIAAGVTGKNFHETDKLVAAQHSQEVYEDCGTCIDLSIDKLFGSVKL